MDSSLLRQFGFLFRRNRARFNQRLVIFGFFILVSTLFWYLSKLSHEYSSTINYPIKFVHLPTGKVLVGTPPEKISLRVKAFGYTLLRYKMSAVMIPLEIDLQKTRTRLMKNSSTKLFINTSTLTKSISTQLSGDLILEDISPDTLFIEFAKVVEKKVKVKLKHRISFEKQYMQSGEIISDPDSITLSGPKSIIDTLKEVTSRLIKFEKLNETTITPVKIRQIPQVAYSHKSVKVTIPVEKYTEKSIKVLINVMNIPDGYQVITLPDAVDVRLNVTLSHYFDLKSQMFRVFSYYKPISGNELLEVKLESFPEFVQIIDFEPKQVEYIIKKQ